MQYIMYLLDAAQGTRIRPHGIIDVMENDSLTLRCYASCYPPCTFAWIRSGETVLVSNKFVFDSIGKNDRGLYGCIAENGVTPYGHAHVTIRVNCEYVTHARTRAQTHTHTHKHTHTHIYIYIFRHRVRETDRQWKVILIVIIIQ